MSIIQHAGKWFEIDPPLVEELLSFFPKLSASSRFICHLRRSLRELDTEHDGRLDTDDVEQALYMNNLALEEEVIWKLLDALDRDASGTVYYEDLIELFEAYQLPWYEMVDDVAAKMGRFIFGGKSKNKWKAFAALRRYLFSRDKAQTGEITGRMLKDVLVQLGFPLDHEETSRLVEALEVTGVKAKEPGAMVRYRDLLRYLLQLNGEAIDAYCKEFYDDVRHQLADQEGGLKQGVERIQRFCREHDKDRAGRSTSHARRICGSEDSETDSFYTLSFFWQGGSALKHSGRHCREQGSRSPWRMLVGCPITPTSMAMASFVFIPFSMSCMRVTIRVAEMD